MKKHLLILISVILLLGGCTSAEPTAAELLEQENYAAAAEKFTEAIDDNRNRDEAYRGLGIVYWEQGDYQRARASFSRALNYGAKGTASIYQFLGSCDLQLGYAESALEWFEKGIEAPDATAEMIQEMEFNQIVAYEKLGNWNKAKEKLTAYVTKYPDDKQAVKENEFLETR